MATLVNLIIVLAVIGVLLWLINSYVPMHPAIKKIINVICIVALCLWLLRLLVAWLPS